MIVRTPAGRAVSPIRLLLALDDMSGVLAIKISQTTAEFSASEAPPDRHQLTELPEFPASTPTFYVHDKDSKMAVQTHRASPSRLPP